MASAGRSDGVSRTSCSQATASGPVQTVYLSRVHAIVCVQQGAAGQDHIRAGAGPAYSYVASLKPPRRQVVLAIMQPGKEHDLFLPTTHR